MYNGYDPKNFSSAAQTLERGFIGPVIPDRLRSRLNSKGFKKTGFLSPKLIRISVLLIFICVAAIIFSASTTNLFNSQNEGFVPLYSAYSSVYAANTSAAASYLNEPKVSAVRMTSSDALPLDSAALDLDAEDSASAYSDEAVLGLSNSKANYAIGNSVFSGYRGKQLSASIYSNGTLYEISAPQLYTVGDILNDLNITLGSDDITNYPLETVLEPGMKITVSHVTYSDYTVSEYIPFETEYRSVQTIPRGTEKIDRAGSNGITQRTYRQKYIDGTFDSETLVSDNISVQPTSEIVLRGVGGTYVNAKGESYDYSYYLDVTATAYSTLSGITYSGKAIKLGMIAVDPSVIPLGTQLYVVGDYGDYGVCSAEDTGGAIIGNKIDIYLGDDMQVLMNFGIRQMRVYIFD